MFLGGITLEDYMTTKETAEKWGVCIRQVQYYCQKKIIPGVITVGKNYLIPKSASKPMYGFFSAPGESIKE